MAGCWLLSWLVELAQISEVCGKDGLAAKSWPTEPFLLRKASSAGDGGPELTVLLVCDGDFSRFRKCRQASSRRFSNTLRPSWERRIKVPVVNPLDASSLVGEEKFTTNEALLTPQLYFRILLSNKLKEDLHIISTKTRDGRIS